MHVLIIGCGYLGRRAAKLWIESGSTVTALTRSKQHAADLLGLGVTPILGDVMDRASLASLPPADVLLYAVGHDRTAASSKRDVAIQGLSNVLEETNRRVGRFVYVSSVSVYGQSDGCWVDEDANCDPAGDGGRICLDAEAVFQKRVLESRPADGHILRLAGLYGPGRLIARTDQLMDARPISGNPEAWLNLIHVEDAAQAVVASAASKTDRETYIVSDDRPVTRVEFYSRIADLIEAPPPVFDPQLPTTQRSTGQNKRCRNTRMRTDLLPNLTHADISTGLPASIASGD